MINSWKELPLGKYRQISGLKEDEDWQWNVLAILNDTTYEDIVSRPLEETMRLSRELHRWIDDKVIIHPVRKQYVINGKKYDFRGYPNDITTSMYIDFHNTGRKVPEDMPDMLSIFMVPEGHKYNDGYDMDEVKKDMSELNVEDAMSVCDFFSSLFQVLFCRALKQARKALKKARKDGVETTEAEKAINAYLRSNGSK